MWSERNSIFATIPLLYIRLILEIDAFYKTILPFNLYEYLVELEDRDNEEYELTRKAKLPGPTDDFIPLESYSQNREKKIRQSSSSSSISLPIFLGNSSPEEIVVDDEEDEEADNEPIFIGISAWNQGRAVESSPTADRGERLVTIGVLGRQVKVPASCARE